MMGYAALHPSYNPLMTTATPTHVLRGIFFLLLALVFFAVLDATVKQLTATFAVPFLVWARYAVHCVLMLIFLAPSLRGQLVRTDHLGAQIVRALMLLSTTACGVFAFRTMPLAETTAVIFLSPLMVALLAGPMLGEKQRAGRWIAVLAGFSGVLLIAHPGGALNVVGVLWALGGAVSYTAYQILTRRLSHHEHPMALLFYTALVGTVAMSAVLPWYWHQVTPTTTQWLMLWSMGILGGSGHYLLIRAFRLAPASTLSPFLYVQLVWAALLGWLVFDHLPDGWTVLGMLIIATSGLWIALGEHKGERKGEHKPT